MIYQTVVADPPWEYHDGWPGWGERTQLPYAAMSLSDICALPVQDWLAREGYLFLWTTNRYLRAAYDVIEAWGCHPTTVLVWCKSPRGKGPGGMFAITTEFVIVAQRIRPGTHAHGRRTSGQRIESSWFQWPRRKHSEKPEEFYALVERVSPGPYLELFARRPRLGWDVWGDEVPNSADIGLSA